MKRLGKVGTISHSGKLIVQSDFAPGVGFNVFDGRKNLVGKVASVMGPVKNPYVAIYPKGRRGDNLLRYINMDLFIQEDRRGRR